MVVLGAKLKSRMKRLSGYFVWPSDRKDCLAILPRIERLKTLIGLALHSDHLYYRKCFWDSSIARVLFANLQGPYKKPIYRDRNACLKPRPVCLNIASYYPA